MPSTPDDTWDAIEAGREKASEILPDLLDFLQEKSEGNLYVSFTCVRAAMAYMAWLSDVPPNRMKNLLLSVEHMFEEYRKNPPHETT